MNNVGIGTRTLNFLIDSAIIFIITYIANTGWVFYAQYYHVYYLQFPYIFLIVQFLYYLFFELLFSRTPAKWVTYSKVVNRSGGKPSFIQLLLRSFTRLIILDCFFIPFLDKPLHDYLSKTEVVEL